MYIKASPSTTVFGTVICTTVKGNSITALSLPSGDTFPAVSVTVATTLENEGYNLSTLVMGTQTGSHVDAPYHFSNEGVSSWYDFAVAIMELSNIKCKIEPLETKQYVTRAIRPPFSVLNKSKIKNEFGISIPHWMDGLRRCIGTLHEGQNISEE